MLQGRERDRIISKDIYTRAKLYFEVRFSSTSPYSIGSLQNDDANGNDDATKQ